MPSMTVSFMFVVAVAHAAVVKSGVKKPFLKVASELQREIERVSSELADEPGRGGKKTREIQTEVEFMVNRVKSLHDKSLTSEFTNEIEGIEEALSKETTDNGLTTEINEVRASLCAQNGFENHDFASCEAFMRKSCAPADTADSKYSDAAPLESFCVMFFREEAISLKATASAPAPGPAAGPGGAPGPAPMGPFFGGKGIRDLPDQGFTGALGKHADFDTMLDDWQKEFGPKAGHRNFDEICADFPDNQWCRIHGYHPRQPRKTVVVTKTVEVPSDSQEANTVAQVEREGESPPPPPDSPERSGTSGCRLTLTALLAAVAMFAK